MIVFVDGRQVEIKEPTPVTLKKYGLTILDWREIVSRQGYCCPICKRILEKSTNIDHLHVQGWRRMKPENRKLWVRGVTCWWCNKSFLARGITLEKSRNTTSYLEAFERRRPR